MAVCVCVCVDLIATYDTIIIFTSFDVRARVCVVLTGHCPFRKSNENLSTKTQQTK